MKKILFILFLGLCYSDEQTYTVVALNENLEFPIDEDNDSNNELLFKIEKIDRD